MHHRPYGKTNKSKESRRHAAVLEMPETVYQDCKVKLEKATVKCHKTTMLTLLIGG